MTRSTRIITDPCAPCHSCLMPTIERAALVRSAAGSAGLEELLVGADVVEGLPLEVHDHVLEELVLEKAARRRLDPILTRALAQALERGLAADHRRRRRRRRDLDAERDAP